MVLTTAQTWAAVTVVLPLFVLAALIVVLALDGVVNRWLDRRERRTVRR